jgi:hypothetical protein
MDGPGHYQEAEPPLAGARTATDHFYGEEEATERAQARARQSRRPTLPAALAMHDAAQPGLRQLAARGLGPRLRRYDVTARLPAARAGRH